ncbi:flagellar hook-length control protein FliK [Halomonas sp. I5-271120]|uniref:flagellar hook-length control protein FliK n=1 Tax=Halomonas sp. I5-271120 TaxID=3061632 RepID=UPI002714DC15|nr:flagellar hook-length control protein FliK [Halomonas sp. I5-271120]
MDIIDVMSAPSSSSKATGRQASGAQQGATQDFGALLSQRQTHGDGKQAGSSTQTLSTSQDASLASLEQAVSALSPEQQSALKEQLQQDPAALEALTSSQQEALTALLDGEALGDKAYQDLSDALSALESLPKNAQQRLASGLDGSQTWVGDVDTGAADSSIASGTSPDATPSTEIKDGPLGLAMIAARMNLIDQVGSSAAAASNGDKLALAGQAAANGDGRRDQATLSQTALNTDWLNRNAVAQAVSDSSAAATNRQSMAGTVFSDSAAAALMADGSDARSAAFSSSSASSDMLALSAGDRLTGMAGTASSPASVAASAQAQAGSGALTAPVASQQWQQQLGQQLLGMTQRGDQQMELKLHPADLGPLSVSLKVAEHGGAQAQFLSAHSQVRNALEQAMPQLREALAQQGITLGDTSVGHQASGQQPQEQGLAGRQSQGPGSIGDTDESVVDPRSMLSSTATTQLDGRVDLYA